MCYLFLKADGCTGCSHHFGPHLFETIERCELEGSCFEYFDYTQYNLWLLSLHRFGPSWLLYSPVWPRANQITAEQSLCIKQTAYYTGWTQSVCPSHSFSSYFTAVWVVNERFWILLHFMVNNKLTAPDSRPNFTQAEAVLCRCIFNSSQTFILDAARTHSVQPLHSP